MNFDNIFNDISQDISENMIEIINKELGLDDDGILPSLFDKDNKPIQEVLNQEISLCEKWISSHQEIVKTIKKEKVLSERKKKIIKQNNGKNNMNELVNNLQEEKIIKQYELSLKRGYSILQHIYRTVSGVGKKEYMITVKGKNGQVTQDLILDTTAILKKVSLDISTNMKSLQSTSNFITRTSLKLKRENFEEDIQKKMKDMSNEEKLFAQQIENYRRMIQDIYDSYGVQKFDKGNYNKGWINEALKSVLLQPNGEAELMSLYEEYLFLKKENKNFLIENAIFEGDKKSYFNKVRSAEEDKKSIDFFQRINTLFSWNRSSPNKGYRPDNVPSYAGFDIQNYELKYLDYIASLISAETVVSGIVRALQTLKKIKDGMTEEDIKKLKKQTGERLVLQGKISEINYFVADSLEGKYKEMREHLLGKNVKLTK